MKDLQLFYKDSSGLRREIHRISSLFRAVLKQDSPALQSFNDINSEFVKEKREPNDFNLYASDVLKLIPGIKSKELR